MPTDYATLLKSREKISEEDFKKIPPIEITNYVEYLVKKGFFKDEIKERLDSLERDGRRIKLEEPFIEYIVSKGILFEHLNSKDFNYLMEERYFYSMLIHGLQIPITDWSKYYADKKARDYNDLVHRFFNIYSNYFGYRAKSDPKKRSKLENILIGYLSLKEENLRRLTAFLLGYLEQKYEDKSPEDCLFIYNKERKEKIGSSVEEKLGPEAAKKYHNLVLSLSNDDLRNICRQHQITGYSSKKKQQLIELVASGLKKEEFAKVLNVIEDDVVNKSFNVAINKIKGNGRETISSLEIVDPDNNGFEISFQGINWTTTSYLSITPDNINSPDRDCDCTIGANMGYCGHFWVGFIYALKQGYFNSSDWTLTKLPDYVDFRVKRIKFEDPKKIKVSKIKEEPKDSLTFDMPSSSNPNKVYEVKFQNGKWTCTCPQYTYRKAECKHIRSCKDGY